MPGVFGVTVVTNAWVTYHYPRGCGRIERPAFPAPCLGRENTQSSGDSRRENAEPYLNVIASAAKQSSFLCAASWIASSQVLLAMTAK